MGWPTVREVHGKTPEAAHSWALSFVEKRVMAEIKGRCWPIPVRRDDNSHVQGWGFDSLLGAMWLQMQWIMLGQSRRCEWCGDVLVVEPEQTEQLGTGTRDAAIGRRRKSPRHKRFCNATCRQNWNYYRGTGTSSKEARKRQRDHKRGKS